jgi:hypothetical protein
VQQLQPSEAGPSNRIRVTAWVVIGVLAACQAYAHRYAISPDGVSYLDLSDAIVTGDLSRLVNLYWSPLYPALIGVARLVTSARPAVEIQIVHAVNFVTFVALFAAFEYLLISILELARRTRHSILGGIEGQIGAYAVFGFVALTMLPQELTTPDLLSGTCMLATFGALFRLEQGSAHDTRDGLILGVSLGLGALAKSFMVPWAVVCLVVLFLATRSRGWRLSFIAGGICAIIVVPWTAILTHTAGHFTFGDTGRFTYVWYVNGLEAPSIGGVPPGARTPATDMILRGVGATGPAPGTDPMWFDPARWNAMLKPHFDVHDQLVTLKILEIFYLQSLTPLVFMIFLIITAPRGSRRRIWWDGWVVYVPAAAGILAYALVLVTARYVMPFVLAASLTMLAATPRPRRMLPLLAVLGIVIPLGLEAASTETIIGLTVVASIVAGMTAAALISDRRPALWTLGVIAVTLGAKILLPPSAPDIARMGVVLIAVVFWFAARSAVRAHQTIAFARRTSIAMTILIFALLGLRFEIRVKQDLAALVLAASSEWGNVSVKVAEDLASHGVAPGARIALIGPHAESYWARSGRLNIVADVPRTQVSEFWKLPTSRREALLNEFAAAGATVAVASVGPDAGAPDSSWTPVKHRGWIRKLRP